MLLTAMGAVLFCADQMERLGSSLLWKRPHMFIQFAASLQHPLDSPQMLDQSNMRAMLAICEWPQSQVLSFRARNLKWYTNLALELKSDELALRRQMNPQVQAVLNGKRLLLFKRVCEDAMVGDLAFSGTDRGFSD